MGHSKYRDDTLFQPLLHLQDLKPNYAHNSVDLHWHDQTQAVRLTKRKKVDFLIAIKWFSLVP